MITLINYLYHKDTQILNTPSKSSKNNQAQSFMSVLIPSTSATSLNTEQPTTSATSVKQLILNSESNTNNNNSSNTNNNGSDGNNKKPDSKLSNLKSNLLKSVLFF